MLNDLVGTGRFELPISCPPRQAQTELDAGRDLVDEQQARKHAKTEEILTCRLFAEDCRQR